MDGLGLLGAAAVAAAAVAVTSRRVPPRLRSRDRGGCAGDRRARRRPRRCCGCRGCRGFVARAAVAAVVVPVVASGCRPGCPSGSPRLSFRLSERSPRLSERSPRCRGLPRLSERSPRLSERSLAAVVRAVATAVRAASPRSLARLDGRLARPRLSRGCSARFVAPVLAAVLAVGAEVASWPGAVARDSRTSVAAGPVSCRRGRRRPSRPGDRRGGRCGRRRPSARGRGLLHGGRRRRARRGAAACRRTRAAGAAATGAPHWRARIAVTRSPLRILAVPLRPRLLASALQLGEAHGGESATAAG